MDHDEVMTYANLDKPGYDLRKRCVLSFYINVDLDKRIVPSESLCLGQRSSAGNEFYSIGAKYLKDQFRIVLLDVTAGQ